MERKNIRDTMIVIWIIWFVITTVVLMGWMFTSEQVYDLEKHREVAVHDEDWSSMLKIGTIGVFALGFLVLMSPSPRNDE